MAQTSEMQITQAEAMPVLQRPLMPRVVHDVNFSVNLQVYMKSIETCLRKHTYIHRYIHTHIPTYTYVCIITVVNYSLIMLIVLVFMSI